MTDLPRDPHRISIDLDGERVAGLLLRPDDARALLVLAHGAGADMHHPFMTAISDALASVGIATVRYQFPFMQARRRRPDPGPVLLETVRAAVAAGHNACPDLPLFAGGKSLGGRMTSMAEAEEPFVGLKGLVFYGFPLHPAGRPGIARAQHLIMVDPPMLFLQGEHDRLAEQGLLRPLVEQQLGRGATLHVVADADHGFHVPKRTGRTDQDVILELARTTAAWAMGIL